ncbi:MAG: zinc-dependent metalloprotease, partial [Bacteroidetes bacterium]|nr:zinc-dependent metalloprotease [Bacteroidota bacterium]
MRPLVFAATLALSLCLPPSAASAQDALPSIADKTEGLQKKDGFVPIYWDAANAKIFLEVGAAGADEREGSVGLDQEFLYLSSLPAGLGSNDIGLDRGLLGGEKVVHFERVGKRAYLMQPNLRFRASSDNAKERAAVEDAFATSIVWGFEVVAETDGRSLVDATDFIVRDAMDVAGRLKSSRQGSFNVDKNRSMPYVESTKAFPDNTELEARVTFASSDPGGWVRSVAADADAVTLRIRQSLIRLPDDNYTPRAFDPRSGFGALSYVDYSSPIGDDKVTRYLVRHRLEKTNPEDASSPVVEPIIYYLDPGTPEPIRSALLDGARWWADAFAAAGFEGAYKVEMLPDGADPMDVRYNTIQWVHRSTRGWSYGASVVDPRTGEIIKGHVSLGSLRVRQDYLIAEGLLAPYKNGTVPPDDPMLQMALARIRQLGAHEVGHTLGLAHNFAASISDRASVMDYPAPLATVSFDGKVLLDRAYDTGIGEWDKVTIAYGYSEFPDGTDEEAALEKILQDARSAGLEYISDTDARPLGGAHPDAHLWDNGSDPIAALENEMDVRQVALSNFTEDVIRNGRPMATIEEALVPLYLRHRYQIEAVSKLIGGVRYEFSVKGREANAPRPV